MQKEPIFDIELSPKTRVSNKSPFLVVETTIKIPNYSNLKPYMNKKNVLVSYTDSEIPNDLDARALVKEMNKETTNQIDLSECFILLISFKIEDGKVEMAVNHGTSKKKKKRKIDKNDEEEEEDCNEGDCKFQHYKGPIQLKQYGEMQEKQYGDYCEMSLQQKTLVDIKTHFVKNRNHKIFMEAELLVPTKMAEYFQLTRRRIGYKAIELINYRFELESEIYCAELLQKYISKINFSMDKSKVTTLKFSEKDFLKTFEGKKVIELITSLLQLEELDLSEISLKNNATFYNNLFPSLYQKCYKLKKIVLQGPKEQWLKPGVGCYHFLCLLPRRNWDCQIYAGVMGKEFGLDKFLPEDLQLPKHYVYESNFSTNGVFTTETLVKVETPSSSPSPIANNNMNNNININNSNNFNNNFNNGINMNKISIQPPKRNGINYTNSYDYPNVSNMSPSLNPNNLSSSNMPNNLYVPNNNPNFQNFNQNNNLLNNNNNNQQMTPNKTIKIEQNNNNNINNNMNNINNINNPNNNLINTNVNNTNNLLNNNNNNNNVISNNNPNKINIIYKNTNQNGQNNNFNNFQNSPFLNNNQQQQQQQQQYQSTQNNPVQQSPFNNNMNNTNFNNNNLYNNNNIIFKNEENMLTSSSSTVPINTSPNKSTFDDQKPFGLSSNSNIHLGDQNEDSLNFSHDSFQPLITPTKNIDPFYDPHIDPSFSFDTFFTTPFNQNPFSNTPTNNTTNNNTNNTNNTKMNHFEMEDDIFYEMIN